MIFSDQKRVTESKICVLIFSTNLSGIFLFLRRIWQDVIIYVHEFSRKTSVFLIRFNGT